MTNKYKGLREITHLSNNAVIWKRGPIRTDQFSIINQKSIQITVTIVNKYVYYTIALQC